MSSIYLMMCNHPPTKAMGSLAKNADSQPTLVGPSSVGKEDPLELENKRSAPSSETDCPQQKKHRVEQASSKKTPSGQGNASYDDQDVLSGRGGGTNLHPGNRHYRDLILSHRQTYDIASKSKKPNVSRNIVQMVRDRGGKFLRKEKDGLYYDIGDEAAREKTSQALRHRTFEMRNKDDSRKQDLLKAKEEYNHFTVTKDVELGAMEASIYKHPDLSTSERTDKLFQEQIYQEALARQHQLNVDSRHQDPAYLRALYSLRQREARLDMDKAIFQETQMMRRHISLRSGLPPLPQTLSSALFHDGSMANSLPTSSLMLGRQLPPLGLASHRDPSLLLSPPHRRGFLGREMQDVAFYPPGPALSSEFLPDGRRLPPGSGH